MLQIFGKQGGLDGSTALKIIVFYYCWRIILNLLNACFWMFVQLNLLYF